MKRFAPLLAVAVLIVVLGFLGKGINKTAQPDHDDDDATQQSQTDKSKTAPTPPSAPVAMDLPPEEIVGDPTKARIHVLLGWQYDEAALSQPQPMVQTIQAVKQVAAGSNGAISAVIVDVSVPPEDRSPAAQAVTDAGLTVYGATPDKKLAGMPGNPGVGPFNPGTVDHMLTAMLKAPMAPPGPPPASAMSGQTASPGSKS